MDLNRKGTRSVVCTAHAQKEDENPKVGPAVCSIISRLKQINELQDYLYSSLNGKKASETGET
jgi:cytochrome c2